MKIDTENKCYHSTSKLYKLSKFTNEIEKILSVNKLLFFMILIVYAICSQQLVAQTIGVEESWIKKNYSGDFRIFEGTHNLTVDGSGNIYIVGAINAVSRFRENLDFATIRYNSRGTSYWIRRYNGPGNGEDKATAIAVDGLGNIYATGYSTNEYNNTDLTTIKYNSLGVQLWVQRYNGTANGSDKGKDIKIDALGNVYVTGTVVTRTVSTIVSESDFVTIKYDNRGVQQWVRLYNGTGDGDDKANALALDSRGNVYVTGESLGLEGNYDYLTIKYNSLGAVDWVHRYNGPGNRDDAPYAIAVDEDENVYITGGSVGDGTDYDFATIKYNYSGAMVWLKRYESNNRVQIAISVKVSNSGNVYVAGISDELTTDRDYVTLKYNSDGEQQWVRSYNGPHNTWDYARDLVIDRFENVYVTGLSENRDGDLSTAATTLKYNSIGTEIWNIKYKDPIYNHGAAIAIALDNYNNVYITGYTKGESHTSYNDFADYFLTIKYSQFNYTIISDLEDAANHIADLPINNFFRLILRSEMNLVSFSYKNGNYDDTKKYINAITWELNFLIKNDYLKQETAAPILNILSKVLNEIDPQLQKQIVSENNTEQPKEFKLYQNYPNPFNPETNIGFDIKEPGLVRLSIYNLLGQEVKTLVNSTMSGGHHRVVWNGTNNNGNHVNSGIYICRLSTKEAAFTKKLMLLK